MIRFLVDTPKNEAAAINYARKDVQHETSLMAALHFGANFSLVKKLCDIGYNELLISKEDND